MRSSTNAQQVGMARRRQAAVAAVASVRAEGLEPSSVTQKRLNRYVQGKITVSQLRRDTLNEVKAVGTRTALR